MCGRKSGKSAFSLYAFTNFKSPFVLCVHLYEPYQVAVTLAERERERELQNTVRFQMLELAGKSKRHQGRLTSYRNICTRNPTQRATTGLSEYEDSNLKQT